MKFHFCSNNFVVIVILFFFWAGGKAIYAMDALFGLPRKKVAGHSYREPLHGNLWFGDQLEVDGFVAQSQQSKRIKNVRLVTLYKVW